MPNFIARLENSTPEYFRDSEAKVRLGPFASISNSEHDGHLSIDRLSMLNRAAVGRYFAVGCFSYVGRATIGRFCTFGSRVSVAPFDHPTEWLSISEFQFRDSRQFYFDTLQEGDRLAWEGAKERTLIENDVWIGDNAVVLMGLKVHVGAIIAAGAVVTSDVPPYSIVAGVPAKVVKYRFSPAVIDALLESRWWERELSELSGLDFSNPLQAVEELAARRC